MVNRIFFVCLFVALYSAGSSLRCNWMDHKFRQYSENCLDLVDSMAHNSDNSIEDAVEAENIVAFPNDLYSLAFRASAEDKIGFVVQTLDEVVELFEEDHSSASWEDKPLRDLLNIVTQQAEGLRSCIGGHSHKKNKKLHLYFKRLTRNVLKEMGHTAESWELIRREIKAHLMRADQLLSPLLHAN
ncbi:interferon a3-like [Echeneis naucrates]|uniref:Interferon a3-like n=1 Tax=Echeneis naucrates TaxID=173247 RepID=A0A665WD19_ECHNA|nr:interferon a3-like [Echeneis naucrates]